MSRHVLDQLQRDVSINSVIRSSRTIYGSAANFSLTRANEYSDDWRRGGVRPFPTIQGDLPMMPRTQSPKGWSLVAIAAGLCTVGALFPSAAQAEVPPSLTVTTGATGIAHASNDTPEAPFIDKDGSFHFQDAASLYGATDSRDWRFFSGTNLDTALRDSSLSDAANPANPADNNNNTTLRCNNSPTGVTATYAVGNAGYSQRNYCDLAGGIWVDPDTGDWYGLVHNEFTPAPFGDALHYDSIDFARSTTQGKTWTIVGQAITSPYSTARGDTTAFPNQTYSYGDGDPRLFVDTASGYFYVNYGSRVVNKSGGQTDSFAHVARAPISQKMATGSWQKWFDGAWSQPGIGGKESNVVPSTSAAPSGYTPVNKEYNPANTGTVQQQITAGTLPSKSPLFLGDVTYNAYLGLYVAEPEAATSTAGPQPYYVTDNLATQKWTFAGDTGSAVSASWYRWFLDSANATSSSIVGKTFRSYCSIGCADGTGNQYTNITITSSPAAVAPIDTTKSYTIGAGEQTLRQVAGSAAVTSTSSSAAVALAKWNFVSNGDGSYTVRNVSTGEALGVSTTTTSTRAWGTKPTATNVPAAGPTVGQQWFFIPTTNASGVRTGSYRLVNRYSGLALALSSKASRLAETTPLRTGTDTSGSSVGAGRKATEQSLSFTPTGTNFPNTAVSYIFTAQHDGLAMNVNGGSTVDGAGIIQWTNIAAANEKWNLVAAARDNFNIVSVSSGLCLDVAGESHANGATLVQSACSSSSVSQQWSFMKASGGYQIRSALSGNCVDVSNRSTANGAPVIANTCSKKGAKSQLWLPIATD
ncbi:RICIN domain-containing protein [Leifsonia sp. NPDC058230]|uniref:RICIN domain-containing protein n=1 Tax=Leifsonia sp. NPDC058230 TaxID=3346391 RepID=UPI0036DB190B